jgi:hypothetical protein
MSITSGAPTPGCARRALVSSLKIGRERVTPCNREAEAAPSGPRERPAQRRAPARNAAWVRCEHKQHDAHLAQLHVQPVEQRGVDVAVARQGERDKLASVTRICAETCNTAG